MLLSLPFTYAAKVLPFRRHRIPDSVIVRAYTKVPVAELSASEIIPAIVLERGQARSTLFDWNGRLFRPARRRSNGEPSSTAHCMSLALNLFGRFECGLGNSV